MKRIKPRIVPEDYVALVCSSGVVIDGDPEHPDRKHVIEVDFEGKTYESIVREPGTNQAAIDWNQGGRYLTERKPFGTFELVFKPGHGPGGEDPYCAEWPLLPEEAPHRETVTEKRAREAREQAQA